MPDHNPNAVKDHEFSPQTLGSAYCVCRARFDAPEHNYRCSEWRTRESDQSIAEDLLEYMEYDINEDQQLRAEIFSDD